MSDQTETAVTDDDVLPARLADKADPETFVMRGMPPRAVRFRRGMIVGLCAASAVALVGVTWIALKPASLRFIATTDSTENVVAAKPSEIIKNAPQSYSDIPELGPPLPGDFGEAVLARQRALDAEPLQEPREQAPDQAGQLRLAAQQASADRRKAAREAGVIFETGRTAPNELAAAGQVLPAVTALAGDGGDRPTSATGDTASDPNGQLRKNQFLEGKTRAGTINPHPLVEPASPYMLSAGSIISASLITGLRSDLPGLVTAQVTENAYDSATGRFILIPQGARLIGSYDSQIAFGQNRALVVWQRLIMPDGSSIEIDNAPASDAQGYAGLTDKVDVHTWTLLKGIALSTLLGVGTQLSLGSSESDLVRAVRESTQQTTERASQRFVGKALDVQPTITVRPGARVRIVVHKDLVLRPHSEKGGR
jgi:type IV secretion system protein VirB10